MGVPLWEYTPEQLPGLALPFALSVLLWLRSPVDRRVLVYAVLAAVVSYIVAFDEWRPDGSWHLHIAPVFIFFGIGDAVRARSWAVPALHPGTLFSMTFFSTLPADLLIHFLPKPWWVPSLHGVGGAGWMDGLLVYPLAAAVFGMYFQARARFSRPGPA